MKRLLYLLSGDTDILLRAGENHNEFVIRGIRRIDDNNKVCAEVRVNLDIWLRDRFTEDDLWKYVRNDLAYGLGAAEREYYERLIEEEQDHEDS